MIVTNNYELMLAPPEAELSMRAMVKTIEDTEKSFTLMLDMAGYPMMMQLAREAAMELKVGDMADFLFVKKMMMDGKMLLISTDKTMVAPWTTAMTKSFTEGAEFDSKVKDSPLTKAGVAMKSGSLTSKASPMVAKGITSLRAGLSSKKEEEDENEM
jgi:hypothetical protein